MERKINILRTGGLVLAALAMTTACSKSSNSNSGSSAAALLALSQNSTDKPVVVGSQTNVQSSSAAASASSAASSGAASSAGAVSGMSYGNVTQTVKALADKTLRKAISTQMQSMATASGTFATTSITLYCGGPNDTMLYKNALPTSYGTVTLTPSGGTWSTNFTMPPYAPSSSGSGFYNSTYQLSATITYAACQMRAIDYYALQSWDGNFATLSQYFISVTLNGDINSSMNETMSGNLSFTEDASQNATESGSDSATMTGTASSSNLTVKVGSGAVQSASMNLTTSETLTDKYSDIWNVSTGAFTPISGSFNLTVDINGTVAGGTVKIHFPFSYSY